MNVHISDFWTADRVATLKTLQAKSLSYSEIGELIGTTRNACIGKASRLGLPGKKGATCSSDENARRFVISRSVKRKPRVARPKSDMAETALHLSFAQLEKHQCRYAYGDEPSTFTFCGHQKTDCSSYCAGHASLCCKAV